MITEFSILGELSLKVKFCKSRLNYKVFSDFLSAYGQNSRNPVVKLETNSK